MQNLGRLSAALDSNRLQLARLSHTAVAEYLVFCGIAVVIGYPRSLWYLQKWLNYGPSVASQMFSKLQAASASRAIPPTSVLPRLRFPYLFLRNQVS